MIRRWLPWLAILAVAVAALAVGASSGGEPESDASRIDRIASEVRCPTCRGLSAAESDAKAAKAVREEIRRRVEAGDSDGDIKAYLASRYGDDILLRPPSSGAGALVWALPAAFVVAAAGALVLRFRSRPAAKRTRRALAAAGIAVAAVGAGAALATAAGDRRPGEPLSGSLPTQPMSPASMDDDRVERAQALFAEGEAVEAIKLLDAVVRDHPDHAEALAFRGWYVRAAGLVDEALSYLDRAIAADPSYPFAHLFRGTILLEDKNDPATAAAEIRLFLASDPPSQLVPMAERLLQRALERAGPQPVPTSTTAVASAG